MQVSSIYHLRNHALTVGVNAENKIMALSTYDSIHTLYTRQPI